MMLKMDFVESLAGWGELCGGGCVIEVLARAVAVSAVPPLHAVGLVEPNLIGKLVGQTFLGLLRKRVLGDRLERLLHVDGLLGRGLEVGNLVLALAPLLRALCGYLENKLERLSIRAQ